MSHSVEDFYKKINVIHEKAITLHRERYKKTGEYDETKCKYFVEDIKYLCSLIANSDVDLEINFADLSEKIPGATGK